MLKLATLFLLVTPFSLAPSAFASNQFFGHWAANAIAETSPRHYAANDFIFTVKTRKLARFLSCLREKHPDAHIFLLGTGKGDAASPATVRTAYWCAGEISLSSCQAADQRTSCP